jgi:hypothetical protein
LTQRQAHRFCGPSRCQLTESLCAESERHCALFGLHRSPLQGAG